MVNKKLYLKSGIYKNYEKSFILDEDSLRRIAGVLEASSKDINLPCQVVFYVWRNDNRYYETTNIEDVLNDPNIGSKYIDLMTIEVRNSSPDKPPEPWEKDYIVQILFRKHDKNTATIDIGAEDRNWALLLADKLEPQIERTFKSRKVPDWLIILFYASICYFLYNIESFVSIVSLIPKPLELTFKVIIILTFLVLSFLTLGVGKLRAKFLTKYLGPESVFLWGDEIEKFSNRRRLRRNIFWVVIMGFLISIITNLSFSDFF